jgi:hypothetical protein
VREWTRLQRSRGFCFFVIVIRCDTPGKALEDLRMAGGMIRLPGVATLLGKWYGGMEV